MSLLENILKNNNMTKSHVEKIIKNVRRMEEVTEIINSRRG